MTVALRRCWGRDLDAATLYALLTLRVDVFVVEQSCPYPELDGRDLEATTRHFWLERPGVGGPGVEGNAAEVVSTLRLMEEYPDFRIGRVCTRADERGRGHTARLMAAALADVGPRTCRLSAQSYLADMYARHGFTRDGAEFVEDGIPHVPMVREGRR